jgi:predicted CoA-binding protein
MIGNATVNNFLAGRRLAVVGASDDKANFGGSIYRAFRDHGYEVHAVNPNAEMVAGDRCYPNLASVPAELDGVMVVVNPTAAMQVVNDCIALGIRHIWLFKGLGGQGAVSEDAVKRCHENYIDVVAGACPFMFLEPVGWFHKLHRGMRHLNGSLAKAS